MIQQDLAATLAFLELVHEPLGATDSSLNAFDIGNILRHTRPTAPRVAQSFVTINQLFYELRKDSRTTLFGFDQANHVYLHAITHRSIRDLWEGLLSMALPSMGAASAPFEQLPGVSPTSAIGPIESLTAAPARVTAAPSFN